MKIIIENGGSKLDWTLLESNIINTTQSINVFNPYDLILNQIHEIFPLKILNQKDIEVDFYTNGFSTDVEQKMKSIFQQSFHLNHINIFSDMLAASRALFNHDEGIACILGTGSNCAYFDGKENKYIKHSLGHLLGDEGSGYDLGKSFLIQYFQNKIPHNLSDIFEEYTNMKKDKLLSSIYRSSNQKFYIASFSKFLKQHESNSVIKQIIRNSFLNFLNTHPFTFSEFRSYKFGFVGSVAFHFRDIIVEILDQEKLEYLILETPMKNLHKYYI